MKIKWLIGGVVGVLLVIIIVVSVSGVKDNKIVGTWRGEKWTWTFDSQGNYVRRAGDHSSQGKYEISGNTMTLYQEEGSVEKCQIEISDLILTITAHVKQSDGTIKDITSSFSKEE